MDLKVRSEIIKALRLEHVQYTPNSLSIGGPKVSKCSLDSVFYENSHTPLEKAKDHEENLRDRPQLTSTARSINSHPASFWSQDMDD
jgi:hypothetical protein